MEQYTKKYVVPNPLTKQQIQEDLENIFSSNDSYNLNLDKHDYNTFLHYHAQLEEFSNQVPSLNETLNNLEKDLNSRVTEMKEKVK